MKKQVELLDKYAIIKPSYRGKAQNLCHEILKVEAVAIGGRNVTVKRLPFGPQSIVDKRALWVIEYPAKSTAERIVSAKEDMAELHDGLRVIDNELFSDIKEIIRSIQNGEQGLIGKLYRKTNALHLAHSIAENTEILLDRNIRIDFLEVIEAWEKKTKKWAI